MIDTNVRLYNRVQLDDEPILVFSPMPATTLRLIEWAKIAEVMDYKLEGDVWERYVTQGALALSTSELQAIRTAET